MRLSPLHRRAAVAVALLAAALGGWAAAGLALKPAKAVEVWKAQSCGCCVEWISYMERHGYKVTVHDVDDVDPVKDGLGVPEEVRSCHTARIGDLVVEGHVPVEALEKVLAERPPGVRGIAVPDMPPGAPGMDESDEPFTVVTFGGGGVAPYGTYRQPAD